LPTLKNETLTMCTKNSLIKFCNNYERPCMGYFSYTRRYPPIGHYPTPGGLKRIPDEVAGRVFFSEIRCSHKW